MHLLAQERHLYQKQTKENTETRLKRNMNVTKSTFQTNIKARWGCILSIEPKNQINGWNNLKKMWDWAIKCGGQGRVLQIELRLCQHAWCLIPRLTNVPRPNPNTFLHIVATDAGLKDLKFRHQFAKNTFFLEILTAQNLDAIYVINNVTWLPLLKL